MIRIISKSEKKAGQLRDGLRIMAWEQFKIDKQLKNDNAFGGYESFKQEWNDHEVHDLSYQELLKFCNDLEYSEEDILKYRSMYYERKSRWNHAEEASASSESDRASDSKSYLSSLPF